MKHGIKHARSQKLIDFACEYATEAHGDQKRKYTGEPYIVHPIEVAMIVASVTDCCEMISAAFLHDVIEDTDKSYEDIHDAGFRHPIADLVQMLTDKSKPSDGNRAVRKEIDRQHISEGSPQAKTIKLADIIDNTKSICEFDPNFAKVYMSEITKLLPMLIDGDKTLFAKANMQIIDYYHTRARNAERELKCKS